MCYIEKLCFVNWRFRCFVQYMHIRAPVLVKYTALKIYCSVKIYCFQSHYTRLYSHIKTTYSMHISVPVLVKYTALNIYCSFKNILLSKSLYEGHPINSGNFLVMYDFASFKRHKCNHYVPLFVEHATTYPNI